MSTVLSLFCILFNVFFYIYIFLIHVFPFRTLRTKKNRYYNLKNLIAATTLNGELKFVHLLNISFLIEAMLTDCCHNSQVQFTEIQLGQLKNLDVTSHLYVLSWIGLKCFYSVQIITSTAISDCTHFQQTRKEFEWIQLQQEGTGHASKHSSQHVSICMFARMFVRVRLTLQIALYNII